MWQCDRSESGSGAARWQTHELPGETASLPVGVWRAVSWGFLLHVKRILGAADAAGGVMGEGEGR